MKYNINIREEYFGATIMNLQNGKREYINKKELNLNEDIVKFSDDKDEKLVELIKENEILEKKIRIGEQLLEQYNNKIKKLDLKEENFEK